MSRNTVFSVANPFLLGAMGTAEENARLAFHAMAENPATTVVARRRKRVDAHSKLSNV
jgi:hypothetical protein